MSLSLSYLPNIGLVQNPPLLEGWMFTSTLTSFWDVFCVQTCFRLEMYIFSVSVGHTNC